MCLVSKSWYKMMFHPQIQSRSVLVTHSKRLNSTMIHALCTKQIKRNFNPRELITKCLLPLNIVYDTYSNDFKHNYIFNDCDYIPLLPCCWNQIQNFTNLQILTLQDFC